MSNSTTVSNASHHVQVAKAIRAMLKEQGIVGKVKASGANGTTSVSVVLMDATPTQSSFVKRFAMKHRRTRAFEPCLEVPKVNNLWIDVEYSDTRKQEALDVLSAHYGVPAMSVDAIPTDVIVKRDTVNMVLGMRNLLKGMHMPHIKFWADDTEQEAC